LSAATGPYALEAVAHGAMIEALSSLKQVMVDCADFDVRVKAADSLLKFATQALKSANEGRRTTHLTASRASIAGDQGDLFDVMGDWQLKKPGV